MKGLWSCACALTLLALAASGPARANDDDFSLQDEPGPDGQPMPLEVMLNGQLVGVWICVIKNSDLWLPDAELVKAGITLPKSAHREPGPAGTMVSMFSLGSDASFTLDLKALRAMVLLGKSLLGVHVLDLRAAPRPDNLELQSEFSVFSSYALQADTSRQFNVFTEVGASSGGLVAQTQLSRLQSGLVVRGNSAVTYDDPKHLLAFAMGDSVALAPGAIWGGALLGGLSLRRDRSLDPYGVYSPLPSQQGFAATPSVLDVYVDGALVRSVPVAPGTFSLQNLPVTTGAQDVRTVLRDAFGRQQSYSIQGYYSAGLLASGYADFSLNAGFQRRNFGTGSFDYGAPAALGSWRYGFTSKFTAGARVEAAGGGLLNAGGSITAAPVIGELELTGAVSRGAGGTVGGAGSIAWSYLGGNLGGGLVLRLQSPEYANVSQAASVDRALWTVNGYLNVPVGQRLTLTVDLLALQSRDSGQSGHATLRGQLSIAQQLALSASVGMQADPLLGRPGLMADVGLFWTLGQRQASALSGSRDATGHSTGQMSSQLDLPTGDGYGYRVSTAASELPSVSAAALQQGEHERLEIGVDTSTHTTVGHATISGGVVALGGRVFFTRALDQSWALVRTGVPNVRSYLENHDIGRTDDDGDLLITGLHPYMANHIGIDPTDVPLTYELGDLEHLVAPYARGGLTVRFEVQKASAVAGTMQLVTDAPIEGPLGAELSVEVGGVQTSVPVGQQGRFFIEGLSAGKHEAEVVFNGGTCKLELDVPASGGYGAVIDLGDVPCAQTIASNR